MLLDSGFLEFKLDCTKTKDLAVGDSVYSKNFLAGGHVWRIKCYPRGVNEEYCVEYLSIYLELVSHGRDVKAVFDAFMAERDGAPLPEHHRRCVHVYPPDRFTIWGWRHFVERREIEEDGHLIDHDGSVTFVCDVVVLRADRDTSMPPADVASHLGDLLRSGEGSDVSFSVGGETFPAHRAVLAARSQVFKAELMGSMAEATMATITLHDIEPDTFRDMLHFMYTDTVPDFKDCSSSTIAATIEHFEALLVAADRYTLDMLRLVCSQKLNDVMCVDNVMVILRCAELHGCPELKIRCIDFFTERKNFKKLVLTEGYFQLIQSFPSLTQEIKQRIESRDTSVLMEKGSGIFHVLKARIWNLFKAIIISLDRYDVSFSVGGETLVAHRAVLAACSSVFKAELLGSVTESTIMATITVHDFQLETFGDMLRFIYTNRLPYFKGCSSSTIEHFEALLVAADQYAHCLNASEVCFIHLEG
ncbi:hypothetical protein PR202_ga21540 [Eleusine coracana subsp. coracana]|uniref:Uncharacterized protein n=1 Tax=Eleusine coracana subsp. coracana TaxID=191504 RepID=A0AAV5D1W5_ELECO|nr:hypothetical protein PR202_ga21540 [Eleusine coracana subsp. coracana]